MCRNTKTDVQRHIAHADSGMYCISVKRTSACFQDSSILAATLLSRAVPER